LDIYVIIVAGGKGSRMMAAQPKQFLPLKGKSILQHSIEAFHKVDPTYKYIIVLPEEHIGYWQNHCEIKKISIAHKVVKGGSERFNSVKNALNNVPDDALVLIHDGVRPLVSKQTIKRVIEKASKEGNAVPVLPMIESVRKVSGKNSEGVDRSLLFTVQTPQGFSAELIKRAYQTPYDISFTDDASVVERMGVNIHTVEGNRENIKITDAFDLKLAEFYLG
jgi:2-C-methyl-D-erythritol 4-phosphate cytidylyltransferase